MTEVRRIPDASGESAAKFRITSRAVRHVQKVMSAGRQTCSKASAVAYIENQARGNLICLDCGSGNHTRGHAACPAPTTERTPR